MKDFKKATRTKSDEVPKIGWEESGHPRNAGSDNAGAVALSATPHEHLGVDKMAGDTSAESGAEFFVTDTEYRALMGFWENSGHDGEYEAEFTFGGLRVAAIRYTFYRDGGRPVIAASYNPQKLLTGQNHRTVVLGKGDVFPMTLYASVVYPFLYVARQRVQEVEMFNSTHARRTILAALNGFISRIDKVKWRRLDFVTYTKRLATSEEEFTVVIHRLVHTVLGTTSWSTLSTDKGMRTAQNMLNVSVRGFPGEEDADYAKTLSRLRAGELFPYTGVALTLKRSGHIVAVLKFYNKEAEMKARGKEMSDTDREYVKWRMRVEMTLYPSAFVQRPSAGVRDAFEALRSSAERAAESSVRKRKIAGGASSQDYYASAAYLRWADPGPAQLQSIMEVLARECHLRHILCPVQAKEVESRILAVIEGRGDELGAEAAERGDGRVKVKARHIANSVASSSLFSLEAAVEWERLQVDRWLTGEVLMTREEAEGYDFSSLYAAVQWDLQLDMSRVPYTFFNGYYAAAALAQLTGEERLRMNREFGREAEFAAMGRSRLDANRLGVLARKLGYTFSAY